ncbi:MAG: hypothetical protein WDN44_05195 [Sphingomonas sp.]
MIKKARLPRRRFFHLKGGEIELAVGLLVASLLESQSAHAAAAGAGSDSPHAREIPEDAAKATSALEKLLGESPDAVKSMSVDELKALLTPEVLGRLHLDSKFLGKLDHDLKGAIRELEAAFRAKINESPHSGAKIAASDSGAHGGGDHHDSSDGAPHPHGEISPLLLIGGIVLGGGALVAGLSGGGDNSTPTPTPTPTPTNHAPVAAGIPSRSPKIPRRRSTSARTTPTATATR